ncbi:hypothetical protein [Pseudomonas sp. Pse35]|uniref:hypothetical protein n=1 Tax=Pseudomonas sp. Pse35 TaxID=2926021 RepID=UPI0021C9D950|nr:hypothetical protein [Pseudomonas sp. Pse35]
MKTGNIFRNITLTDVDVAVSVPKGADIDFDMEDVTMTRGKTFYEERDEPSLVEQIGLPSDTPPELLVDLVQKLANIPDSQQATRFDMIKKSKLWSFIERSANASSIIQGLLAGTAAAFGAPTGL